MNKFVQWASEHPQLTLSYKLLVYQVRYHENRRQRVEERLTRARAGEVPKEGFRGFSVIVRSASFSLFDPPPADIYARMGYIPDLLQLAIEERERKKSRAERQAEWERQQNQEAIDNEIATCENVLKEINDEIALLRDRIRAFAVQPERLAWHYGDDAIDEELLSWALAERLAALHDWPGILSHDRYQEDASDLLWQDLKAFLEDDISDYDHVFMVTHKHYRWVVTIGSQDVTYTRSSWHSLRLAILYAWLSYLDGQWDKLTPVSELEWHDDD